MAAASGSVVDAVGAVVETTTGVVVGDVVDGIGGAASPGQPTLTPAIFHVPSGASTAWIDERPDARATDG